MKMRALIVLVAGTLASMPLWAAAQEGLDHPAPDPLKPGVPAPKNPQPTPQPTPPSQPDVIQPPAPAADEGPGLADILENPSEIVLIATGFRATEGPLWLPEKNLLIVADMGNDGVFEIPLVGKPLEFSEAKAFRKPSRNTWGNAMDKEGRVLFAEHDRSISRMNESGEAEIIASEFEGKKLNAPNDMAVHSDGSVYFTDPPFGIQPSDRELGFAGVFRLAPDGKVTLLTDTIRTPNGITFSPDYKTLYVTEFGKAEVHAFPVNEDGTLGEGRLFAELKTEGARGAADGLKTDVKGNVYAAGPGGVHVLTPEGKKIGRIKTPGNPSNVAFGGEDGKKLFITAGKNVLYVRTKNAGAHLPKADAAPATKEDASSPADAPVNPQ